MDNEPKPISPKMKEIRSKFAEMMNKWMEWAQNHLTDSYISKASLGNILDRIIKRGLAPKNSKSEGDLAARLMAQRIVFDEQQRLMDINKQRLILLCRLIGKKPQQLEGTTIVSIGGGPGDVLSEPWFPRLAMTTGANVINFDYSPAHPVDQELGIYTHFGGGEGDVFKLLDNEKSIYEFLKAGQHISIIECNNLLGSNISPSFQEQLGDLPQNLINHPQLIRMRHNLLEAAQKLLMEGGILAIDNVYWLKKDGQLVCVDDKGEKREELPFLIA